MLGSAEKKTQSLVVAADFSPDGKNAVASFGDGSVGLWDLQTGKFVKTVLPARPFTTSYIGYRDEAHLLLMERDMLATLRVSFTLGVASGTRADLKQFSAPGHLVLPRVGRLAPQFANHFLVCCESGAEWLILEGKGCVRHFFLDAPATAPAAAFVLSGKNLEAAVLGDGDVCFLRSDGATAEQVGRVKLSIAPSYMSWLDRTRIAIFDNDFAGEVACSDGTLAAVSLDKKGVFVPGKRGFWVFEETNVWEITPETFEEQLAEFADADDFDGAIAKCRDMLAAGRNARAILAIERTLGTLFERKARERGLDAMIDLCSELGIDWVVSEAAMHCYEQAEYFQTFMRRDPEGKMFRYPQRFVAACVESGVGTGAFLLRFPPSTVPTEKLLRSSTDPRFLAAVLTDRCDDLGAALEVLWAGRDMSTLIRIWQDRMDVGVLRWLFAREDRVKALLTQPEDSLTGFFAVLEGGVEEPTLLGQVVNKTIIGLGDALKEQGVDPFQNPVWAKVAGGLMVRKAVRPTPKALTALLQAVFFKGGSAIQERRGVLRHIIELRDLPQQLLETIARWCGPAGFLDERRLIQEKLGRFDEMLEDALRGSGDPIGTLAHLLDDGKRDTVLSFLAKNTRFFAMVEPAQAAEVLSAAPASEIVDLVSRVDEGVRMDLMRAFMAVQPALGGAEWPVAVAEKYTEFLCRFYPDEVAPWAAALRAGSEAEVARVCGRFKIYDAEASLRMRAGDMSGASSALVRLIDLDAGNPACIRLAQEILSRGMDAKAVLSAFVLPVAAEVPGAVDGLRQVCQAVGPVTGWAGVVEHLVTELQELEFGVVRSVLTAVLEDFSYEVEQRATVAAVYEEDAVRAHDELARQVAGGILVQNPLCGSCRLPPTSKGGLVRLFPCGHVFHDDEVCMAGGGRTCRVCVPVESLGVAQAPPVEMGTGRFRQQLARFENLVDRVVDEPGDDSGQVPAFEIRRADFLP